MQRWFVVLGQAHGSKLRAEPYERITTNRFFVDS